MKYTKIITSLFLAAAFMFGTSAMAADKEKKSRGKSGRSNPIMSLSGLTSDQKKEIQAINKELQGKMKEAGQDREKRQAIGKERNEKIMAVLTDAQKDELKKKMAEMRKNRGKGKAKGKGGDKKKKKDS